MKRVLILRLPAAVLLSAMLSACLNLKPAADPTRFYVLSVQPAKQPLPGADNLSLPVCVAKVEIPAYLENPGLAIRQENNVVSYAGYHQWAEPVHLGVARCLGDHLAAWLGAEHVSASTRRYPSGDCLEVQAVLSRFESTASGQARLKVRWRIVNTGTGAVIHAEMSEYQSGASSTPISYSNSVQALSETIALWSQHVAQVLISLPSDAASKTAAP